LTVSLLPVNLLWFAMIAPSTSTLLPVRDVLPDGLNTTESGLV
jgi:hypothetical protein